MKRKIAVTIVLIMVIITALSLQYMVDAVQYVQYTRSGISAFPADYQTKLNEIAKVHPNWKFQAYYTGISWNTLIEKERDESVHRNRVINTSPSSWKHDCNFEENGYACASDEIVAYYLDPRNFLNEKNIFQFVESSYNSSTQTLEEIQKSVKGTYLDSTITCKDNNNNMVTMSYSQMIIEAAKQSNISAFYIKSKIIQETGVNGSDSVNGTYAGYEGYYNFYNYGADDKGKPIENGLKFAKSQGWDSQYKAIVNGAKLIGKKYIEAGQNTAYFNKWDVVGTKILKDGEKQSVQEKDLFWHQYMTNIQDPTNQSYSNYNLYSNNLDGNITFIIPVYNNMPGSNPKPNDVKLNSISLNTTEMNLQVGAEATAKTGYISATYNPSNVTDKVLYWSSSNTNVATVQEGNVKAIGEGTAIITAKSRDGGKTASCKVTVTKIDKALKSITMNTSKVSLKIGETGWVGVTYNPYNSSDKTLYWKSSNEKVATVKEGTIKAIKEGTATITAVSREGAKTATCKLIVHNKNYVDLESIKANVSAMELKIGETGWAGVTYNPSNATNKTLTWKSSNEKVATVKEGTVKAVGIGTATLTATSEDGGKTATCKVTVTDGKKHIESIRLKTDSIEMKPGEGKTIYAEYNPSNVDDKTLYWKSSNEKVVTVNEGYAKAIGEGTATVTAVSRDGGKTASCKVTVTSGTVKLQSIKISSSTEILTKGEGKTIYVTYNPNNVTDKTLYWSSSNEKIATVSEGYVKAVGEGIATLTARSKDGNKTASCQVVVTDKVKEMKNISLKTTKETMNVGEGKTIYAEYNPYNVKDKTLYWISNNEKVVTVSEGYVKAAGKGTATITAVSRDGGKTATCEITVK